MRFVMMVSFGAFVMVTMVAGTNAATATRPDETQTTERQREDTDRETGTDTDTDADIETEGRTELDEPIQILNIEELEGQVTLDIAVPPAIGRLAPVAENFGVTDGGELVDVSVSAIGGENDTVLVIDTSGSMRGAALASATEAAAGFVESLPTDVRVGLISFGDTVIIHQEPTGDRAAVLADLETLAATGEETALWDALLIASELAGESEAGSASVVVLSDGDDTASSANPDSVVRAFDEGATVLYAVAIESPDTNLVALENAVDQIGGQFLATTNLDQLDALYADIGGRLASRYRLRFIPAVQGTRTVVVSVVAGNGVAVASTTLRGVDGSGGGPATSVKDPPPVINVDDEPVLGAAPSPIRGQASGRTLLVVGLVCMFGAMAIGGAMLSKPTAQVRLNAASGSDRIRGVNVRLGHAVDRVVTDYDRGRRIDARLEAADINLRPGEFLLAWLLATVVTALSVLAMYGLIYGVLVVVFSAVVTFGFLNVRINRRRASFADQLSETLGIMASSLRSGQSLPRSIELVAAEAPSPTAEEFHRISFEVRVGRDLTDSILEASRRMGSPDLEWLAQAVDINRELGGDLTEILDNVASTIRERRTVARQIDAMSSEGRATGWVLLSLPVALFLFSWWRTPASIEALFTEPIGRILLAVALSGMTIGHIWIRRLVRLKF